MADKLDYYSILQLNRNATQEEIERAHERLSKQFDPETSRKPRAAQRYAEIQEAYDVLGSREKRREYDKERRRGDREVAGTLMPSDVLTTRFLIAAGGILIASVVALLAVIILLGGDDGEPVVDTTVTATPIPTLPEQEPTTPESSPPEVTGEEVTLPSGLIYIDIEIGEGKPAELGEMVAVNYTGWLEETGELFDSSLERTRPSRVVIGEGDVIEGWHQGLPGMQKGGKRRLIVPPDLAYGEEGEPALGIPPDATLIFDMVLVDILVANPTPTPTPAPTQVQQSPTTAPESPPEVTGEEVTLESGLTYIDIEPGTGDPVGYGDMLAMNYTGWLQSDGTKFDSSLERDMTFQMIIGVSSVIDGWHIGIEGMREGGKRRLIIPPDLAYGDQDRDPIPANSTLIFDVEVVDVLARGVVTPTPEPAGTPTPTPTAAP